MGDCIYPPLFCSSMQSPLFLLPLPLIFNTHPYLAIVFLPAESPAGSSVQ